MDGWLPGGSMSNQPSSTTTKAAGQSPDQQGVQDVVSRWEDYFNQRALDQVATLYTNDASVYGFDGLLHHGRNGILQYMKAFQGPGDIRITLDEIQVLGDDAIAFGKYVFVAPDGSEMFGGNNVTTFQRGPEGWLLRRYLANTVDRSAQGQASAGAS
jgi:uncharacterized protein (TIGR02246 family)